MLIPKSPVQETPTAELMTARTCQISGSQRKNPGPETSQNSEKDDKRFRPSKQELA
jgi:hypothetical protein